MEARPPRPHIRETGFRGLIIRDSPASRSLAALLRPATNRPFLFLLFFFVCFFLSKVSRDSRLLTFRGEFRREMRIPIRGRGMNDEENEKGDESERK